MMPAYEQLEARIREITRLKEVQAITGWDDACMMPSGGGPGRSQALASLATVIHERQSDPEIGELLNRVRGEGELDDWQSANLTNIERNYAEATAVPSDLVRASRLASLQCEQAWRDARARNDWSAIRPLLEEVVGYTRREAEALGDALGLAPYDALLDAYEPVAIDEARLRAITEVIERARAEMHSWDLG